MNLDLRNRSQYTNKVSKWIMNTRINRSREEGSDNKINVKAPWEDASNIGSNDPCSSDLYHCAIPSS